MIAPLPVVASDEEKAAWKEAALYTNMGKEWLGAAVASDDWPTQEMLLGSALATYDCAARAWADALAVTRVRRYDVRFWLADAWNKRLRVKEILATSAPVSHARPTEEDLRTAFATAVAVRDATDGDEYVDAAASFAITAADIARDRDYRRFDESGGWNGFPRRDHVEMVGADGEEPKVKIVALPESVQRAVDARVQYARRVPAAKDTSGADGVKMAVRYAFEAADTYLAYGQLASAKALFQEIHAGQCLKNDYGYLAWEKLILIAGKSRDVGEHYRLVGRPCVMNKEQRLAMKELLGPSVHWDTRIEADVDFVKACGRDLQAPTDRCDPITPALRAKWRIVAAGYQRAFEDELEDEAPYVGHVFRAAFAYSYAGDTADALRVLRGFISTYGDEAKLATLAPTTLAVRVTYLSEAYSELGTKLFAALDYAGAASVYESASHRTRLPIDARREDAANALILFAALGFRSHASMLAAELRALAPAEGPRADYFVAKMEFDRWMQGDALARPVAQAALAAYHRANVKRTGAEPYVFQAAWQLARLARVDDVGAYRSWLGKADAARSAWSQSPTEASKLAYDASSADFTQLGRELHPTPVTATMSLGAIFGGPGTVSWVLGPLPP